MKIPRNALCPCGSGKKYKKCHLLKEPFQAEPLIDEDGMHFFYKGDEMNSEKLDLVSNQYQENIRSSPMWPEMVKEFGKEQAEVLLKQCRAQMR